MLTAACLAVAIGTYLLLRMRRARRELWAKVGITRVRVADLPSHVGARVGFRHPTRRGECVEGRLLAARESLLSLAWMRVTVEAADGRRTEYEVATKDWAQVASM